MYPASFSLDLYQDHPLNAGPRLQILKRLFSTDEKHFRRIVFEVRFFPQNGFLYPPPTLDHAIIYCQRRAKCWSIIATLLQHGYIQSHNGGWQEAGLKDAFIQENVKSALEQANGAIRQLSSLKGVDSKQKKKAGGQSVLTRERIAMLFANVFLFSNDDIASPPMLLELS